MAKLLASGHCQDSEREGIQVVSASHYAVVGWCGTEPVSRTVNGADGGCSGREGRFCFRRAGECQLGQIGGLRLRSSVTAGEDGAAIASITIENGGKDPVKVLNQELALTLLMKCQTSPRRWSAPDGPSFALITPGSSLPRSRNRSVPPPAPSPIASSSSFGALRSPF